MGATSYILGTSIFLHKLYHPFIVLGLHSLMLLFWIVDLGLVANLAHLWSSPTYCYGYYCNYNYYWYKKRDVDYTTVQGYYGALVAGAIIAAIELYVFIPH